MNLLSLYLDQFTRGWSHTSVYILRDRTDEAGNQRFGFYGPDYAPRKAALYLHNLTTILADKGKLREPGKLTYSIPKKPVTVHDMLLQNSDGMFYLVVWSERVKGADRVELRLDGQRASAKVYDPTVGTAPVQTLEGVNSIVLTMTDHPWIVAIP